MPAHDKSRGPTMKTNLTKREFLQLSSAGGVAAFLGLLAGTTAKQENPQRRHSGGTG